MQDFLLLNIATTPVVSSYLDLKFTNLSPIGLKSEKSINMQKGTNSNPKPETRAFKGAKKNAEVDVEKR